MFTSPSALISCLLFREISPLDLSGEPFLEESCLPLFSIFSSVSDELNLNLAEIGFDECFAFCS